MIAVTLPIRTVSESNARDGWRAHAARAKKQRVAAYFGVLAGQGRRPIVLPLVVTLTRIAPSSGLDDDNLRGALKACRDGVADALGVDDRDARVTWLYGQRRGAWGVEVRVEARVSQTG